LHKCWEGEEKRREEKKREDEKNPLVKLKSVEK
jgi:hypothetical protein